MAGCQRKLLLVLVSTILLSTVMCSTEPRKMVSLKENMQKAFREWKCKDPKPRLVYLEDEYDDYDPSALYLPHALVVDRCERSVGCCRHDGICSPSQEEETDFAVETFSRGRKERKEITLIRHVKCECRSLSGAPQQKPL